MHFDARAVVAYDPPVADLAANWLCRSARVEEVLRMKHTAARSKSDASSRSERKDTTRQRVFRKPIASSTSVLAKGSLKSSARKVSGPDRRSLFFALLGVDESRKTCPEGAGASRPPMASTKHGGLQIGRNCGVLHATRPSANMSFIIPDSSFRSGSKQMMRSVS